MPVAALIWSGLSLPSRTPSPLLPAPQAFATAGPEFRARPADTVDDMTLVSNGALEAADRLL